jgi:hypothetical protein
LVPIMYVLLAPEHFVPSHGTHGPENPVELTGTSAPAGRPIPA